MVYRPRFTTKDDMKGGEEHFLCSRKRNAFLSGNSKALYILQSKEMVLWAKLGYHGERRQHGSWGMVSVGGLDR